MITYKFIKGTFHVSLTENIGFSDLVGFLKNLSKIEDLPSDLKVFYDLRQADVHLHLDEINKLSELSEKITSNLNSIKTAFIVEDPTVTAYTMLYSWLPNSDRLKREQFSTEFAALAWLNNENA